jgi:hypothetical protein
MSNWPPPPPNPWRDGPTASPEALVSVIGSRLVPRGWSTWVVVAVLSGAALVGGVVVNLVPVGGSAEVAQKDRQPAAASTELSMPEETVATVPTTEAAVPPSTAAPITQPPTTQPPTTLPPATLPPATLPPVTNPPATTPPAPPPTPAPTSPPTLPPPQFVSAPPDCNPNYTPCVPNASDVDCAGGSGNGPAYVAGPVQVIGSDVYGLDRDGDGIGCE